MIIYVIKQYYYGEMLLVEAFTDSTDAKRKAENLTDYYADGEHYYEVEAIDLDDYEEFNITK